MKNRLCNELARLASAKYQDKYILHGITDEYIVPEELLDTVRATIATVIATPTLSSSLTDTEITALRRFDMVAASVYATLPFDSATSSAQIIESLEWKRLREAAAQCLRELGAHLADLEAKLS